MSDDPNAPSSAGTESANELNQPQGIAAIRAGRARTVEASMLSRAGVATVFLSFPVVWLSQLIAPDNAFRELFRNGLGAVIVLLIAPMMVFVGSALRTRVSGGHACVRVENDSLVIERTDEKAQTILLSELKQGVVVPLPNHDRRLELRCRNGDLVVVQVAESDAGRLDALLVQTGLGPADRTLRGRVAGWRSPLPRMYGVGLLLLLTVIPALRTALDGVVERASASDYAIRAIVLALIASASGMIAQLSLGPAVIIGADGVSVLGALSRRFISHSEIARAEVTEAGGATLTLKDGSTVSLGRVGNKSHAKALVNRIIAAAHVASPSPLSTARAEMLDRAGRSFAEWSESIAKLFGSSGADRVGYRGFALDQDELLRVVADPDAPADRRIGAAMALRKLEGETASTKVRAVAETIADERVRVALESVADGADGEAEIDAATASVGVRVAQ